MITYSMPKIKNMVMQWYMFLLVKDNHLKILSLQYSHIVLASVSLFLELFDYTGSNPGLEINYPGIVLHFFCSFFRTDQDICAKTKCQNRRDLHKFPPAVS